MHRRRKEASYPKTRTDACIDWYKKPTFCGQSNEIRKCWKDIIDGFSMCTVEDQEPREHIRFCMKLSHCDHQWNRCSIPIHKNKTQPCRCTSTRNVSQRVKNNKLWWYGSEWLFQDSNEWLQWSTRVVEANSESVRFQGLHLTKVK